MTLMFFCAYSFVRDISRWNISKVVEMRGMFQCARQYTGDLSRWNVNKVKNMDGMFHACPISEENKPKRKGPINNTYQYPGDDLQLELPLEAFRLKPST
jgi:hypothetical protein